MKAARKAVRLALSALLIPAFTTTYAQTPAVPVPAPPQLQAKSWILIDHHSGRVLAESNSDQRMEPASIVKVMTAYAVAASIRDGKLKLQDKVTISEHAWRTGGAGTDGSTTFLQVGSQVPVEVLLQGMIVQSGNDATIALAERVAGDEATFARLMNNYAKQLGMTNSNFENSTGLPSPNTYMSARDITTLARAMIREFPNEYRYYSQPHYTWNGIKQGNRNGLLARDSTVDGIKTGHTQSAGFCLAASAKRPDGMRLISVVLGTSSFKAREDANLALLNWGFNFYETKTVYSAGKPLGQVKAWKAEQSPAAVGLRETILATVPRGQFASIKPVLTLKPSLMAPVPATEAVGELKVMLGDQVIATKPVYPLAEIKAGGLWTRMVDSVKLWFE